MLTLSIFNKKLLLTLSFILGEMFAGVIHKNTQDIKCLFKKNNKNNLLINISKYNAT
jgi:hypothetical protein